jgi:predicted fused transcriptional regulator/phosphomethylpyrimidine kinase
MHEYELDRVLGNLVRAIQIIEGCVEFAEIIPEVRVNLAYALPNATEPSQVAAVEGRITKVGGRPRAAGLPAFGASDHMARLLVETLHHEPRLRAGINFAYDTALEVRLREMSYSPVGIDRTEEPAEAAGPDRASMPWKIRRLVETTGGIPRLFYESAAPGKEPLFVLLGEDAVGVAAEACAVARSVVSGGHLPGA